MAFRNATGKSQIPYILFLSFSCSVGIKVSSATVKTQELEINHSSHLLWNLRMRGPISPLLTMSS